MERHQKEALAEFIRKQLTNVGRLIIEFDIPMRLDVPTFLEHPDKEIYQKYFSFEKNPLNPDNS